MTLIIDLLPIVAYAAGWLVTAAVVARKAAEEFGDPVGMLDAVIGAAVGVGWPMVFPVLLIKWVATRETPAERRQRLQVEKDHRVQELQFKIRRLEAELGIGQGRAS